MKIPFDSCWSLPVFFEISLPLEHSEPARAVARPHDFPTLTLSIAEGACKTWHRKRVSLLLSDKSDVQEQLPHEVSGRTVD